VNTYEEDLCFDISTTPPRSTFYMAKINYDEQLVGHLKESHSIIGKLTSNSSHKNENKFKQDLLGEDPSCSMYQEECIGSKDKKKNHGQNPLVILPNKKIIKNINKLQPITLSNHPRIIPAISNGHEKQKIVLT